MAKKKTPPYEVGYGKPPKETRFAKGVSGNPKGRPKGKQNLSTVFSRIAGETIVVTEGGRKMTVTKFHAIQMQLYRLGLGGNMAAIKQVLGLASMAEQREETQQPFERAMSRAEVRMLKSLTKQFESPTEEGEK